MALHHGGLGDKARCIRIEVRLPKAATRAPGSCAPGHTDRPAPMTRVILVGAHQFGINDLEVLETLRQAWIAAGYDFEQKTDVPVFGRTSSVARLKSA